jgi:hypothetical protein
MTKIIFHIVVGAIGIIISAFLAYIFCSIKSPTTGLTMWNIISSSIAGLWTGNKIYDCVDWIYESIINKTK